MFRLYIAYIEPEETRFASVASFCENSVVQENRKTIHISKYVQPQHYWFKMDFPERVSTIPVSIQCLPGY